MPTVQDRRRFLVNATMASIAGLTGLPKSLRAEEPSIETTAVRFGRWINSGYCWAPAYIAEKQLRAEGFTDVKYVQGNPNVDNAEWLAHGETDFDINMPSMHIRSIEAGVPIKVLCGLHAGCFELRANDSVGSVGDLRGKKVLVYTLNSHPHLLVQLMANYVGLDPNDIKWVEGGGSTPTDLFIDGKVDAVLLTPDEWAELHARKIGHTIIDNNLDRPWSHYFCCMIAGNADYVSKYPIATKRILRAILKSADICSSKPEWVAQQLVERGFAMRSDQVLEWLSAVSYEAWREFDPEDSIRFYALRMQETGMIKADPQDIIARGTDWRFYNELKRELKM